MSETMPMTERTTPHAMAALVAETHGAGTAQWLTERMMAAETPVEWDYWSAIHDALPQSAAPESRHE